MGVNFTQSYAWCFLSIAHMTHPCVSSKCPHRFEMVASSYWHSKLWLVCSHHRLQVYQPRFTKYHSIQSIRNPKWQRAGELLKHSLSWHTWWASLMGIWNVLFGKTGNSWGVPGYFICEPEARKRAPLPFKTTNTSSHECLCIGVRVPGANVWSHTSTLQKKRCWH